MYSRRKSADKTGTSQPSVAPMQTGRQSSNQRASTGTFLAAESVIMTNAYRYSFHASVKQKINVETIPGRARGKTQETSFANARSRPLLQRLPFPSEPF